jgi:hypothetical protein
MADVIINLPARRIHQLVSLLAFSHMHDYLSETMTALPPSKRARLGERYLSTRHLEHLPSMAEIGRQFDIPSSTVADTLKR